LNPGIQAPDRKKTAHCGKCLTAALTNALNGWSTSSDGSSKKTSLSTTRRLPVKLLEALVILVAGVLFAWWQLRDVSKAQEESARRRKAKSDKPPVPPEKEAQ
jgi:hypothetical protein